MSQLEEHYDRETTRIARIDAKIFGNDLVLAYSVCKDNKDDSISRAELYESGAQPKRGGLVDSRMGAVNRGAVCGHCGLTSSTGCPGHFAHSVFPGAKFNVFWMPYIVSMLSVFCIKCIKPYASKGDPDIVQMLRGKKNPIARLATQKKICKSMKYCPNCGVMVPKISIPKGSGARNSGSIEVVAEYKKSGADESLPDGTSKKKLILILTAPKIYDMFNNMTEDDQYFIGLDPKVNKMSDTIPKFLPFPPNPIRPSVHMDAGSEATREDNMTHKLADMLKSAQKQSRRADDGGVNKQPDLVQFNYIAYLDNSSSSMPRAEQKGVPVKALRDRIRAKTGRVRYNLMGKRVDFSARSVITPDASISVREVVTPLRVAMRLTFKEIVNEYNIGAMRNLVKNRDDKWPGANFVVPYINGKKQKKKYLQGLRRDVQLNIGDEVHRHLQNGDVALFNRQPTLHKQSMMAHIVRVMEMPDAPYHQYAWSTFRIHLSTCSPYNADFDGDEMNMHIPQSYQTQIELRYLASVSRQMVSSGISKPLIGSVQDNTLGGWLLSGDDVRIESWVAMDLMAYSGVPNSVLHTMDRTKTYTGKELLSMILPKDLNMTLVKGSNVLNIDNGIIQPGGNMDKGAFGPVSNGILHWNWFERGHQGTSTLLDMFNKLTRAYLMPTSFTVGSGDIEVSQEIDDSVQKVIDTELLEIQHMITEAETSTVLHDVDIIEPIFQGKMDNVRENVGKAVGKSLSKSNAFSVMEVSGAKGSVLNTAQMMACVGQQAIEAKRVVKRVNGRTLAHYHQDDDSGPARGFIRNNYYKGLTPQEFIFHMMSGREGMIDTAIKTAETGYIQRRLVKALEDLQVLYDATVRTAGGTLLQPLYGYNGIDPSMQAQLRIGLIAANNDDVRKRYCFENEAEAKKHGLSARENEEHYSNLLGMRNQMRDIQRKTSWSAAVLNETITSPVKFDHLIRKWRARSGDYKRESPLDARYVFASIEKMLSHEFTPMYRISQQDLKSEGCIKLRDEQLAKTFLRTILHEYLSPKRCIVEYGFGRERFDELCREAVKKFHMSRIQPGTMVGVICAQSVGQPATQMSTVSGTRMIIMRKRKDENGQSGIYVGPIGTFIDDLVKQNKKYTADLGHDSVETALKQLSEDYYVASLQSDETIKWCKISHVSRHPTNGKLVRMKTASGREITATPSHSFLKRTESSFEAVPAKNLKLGDRMPVAKDLPQFCKTKLTQYKLPGSKFTLQLDRLTGWFFGAYLADGNLHAIGSSIKITKVAPEYQKTVFKFVKERLGVEYRVEERDRRVKDWKKYSHKVYHGESIIFNHKDLSEILHKVCGTGSFVKRVPFFVHMAPKEFIAGMLQGYMDGDGNVSSNRNVHHHTASKVKNNRNSIRTSSVNHRMTTEFALLFNYMGIYPSICKEKASDPNGDGRERAPLHTLQIPYKYAETFKRKIGSCYKARLEDLDNMIAYGRSGKHNDQEYIDKIPKLGACIARLAKNLYRSRAAKEYERWKRKDSIGRRTLQKYITVFEEQMVKFRKTVAENGGYITVNRGSGTVDVDIGARELSEMQTDLETLKQAADSHVVWDAITELEYIEDPKEYVYDFTVPGTETFMIANGMFTHNTLNTFHSAGVAGKSIGNLGVPRLRELMAYSKNPKTPRMTIPLKAEYENRLDIVQSIASELKYTVMNDITKSVQVIWDPDPSDPKSYMQIDQADNIYYGSKCQHDIAGLPWLMRIVLNPEGMLNSGIQLLDIKSRFCTFWGNRVKEIKKLKKKEEKHALDKVTRMAILSNYSTSKEIVIHIRYDTTGVNFNNHMALADLVMHRFKLKGIDGITAVDIDEEQYKAVDERGGLVDKKRYVIHTEGVNLVNIRYLNFIDIPRVVTNHVVDIYAVMGIEAARAATKLEYKKVIEGSGAEADYRHLALLSDFSTNTGNLVPVDRHGMTKSDAEFLAKATNEMTVEQLVDAAFYRQSANMQNVSSRIMTGMAFNGGSNAAKIFIDFDELEKCEYIPEESAKGKRFNALTANHMIDDIIRETERQEAGGSDSDVSND